MTMNLNFCTLFDSNYLTRGLALYYSLSNNCKDFHLYIFTFDEIALDILNKYKLSKVTLISLLEFENEELLEVKKTRTAAEYCWTCTPSTIDFCIKNYNLDHCTYIDADLYFFGNPQILIDEIPENKSVLITEHRYTPKYDQTKTSGKYCVQFMYFKNEQRSLKVLETWRKQCLDWCYARAEDNKFGDQKYLDNWADVYDCVHVLEHLGGGVAPWNIQQYKFRNRDKIFGIEISTNKKFELIFFHFHAYKIFKDNLIILTHEYEISKTNKNAIFYPYSLKINNIHKEKIIIESKLLDKTINKYLTIKSPSFIDNLKIRKLEIQKLLKHKNLIEYKENVNKKLNLHKIKNCIKFKKKWLIFYP